MPAVTRTLALLAAAAAGLGGCSIGSNDASSGDGDVQSDTLACLTDEKGLEARAVEEEDTILVGDPDTGPRIVFYLTAGEAEAAQFEGDGEGAEHIGAALLFVRQGTDDVLEDVENCLGEQ